MSVRRSTSERVLEKKPTYRQQFHSLHSYNNDAGFNNVPEPPCNSWVVSIKHLQLKAWVLGISKPVYTKTVACEPQGFERTVEY